MKGPAGLAAAAIAVAAGFIVLLTMSALSLPASLTGLAADGQPQASRRAQQDIPARMRRLYERAAASCPGLPWTVLAAVGKVETDHGRAADQISTAGAVGPMQFLPSTFAAYAHPIPTGGKRPATPWDRTDAVFAAARLLCRNGARHASGPASRHDGSPDSSGEAIPSAASPEATPGIRRAVFAYNHSTTYVSSVLRIARTYRSSAPPAEPPAEPGAGGSGAGRRAVTWALTQRGKPYVWGAEGPSSYDCSGLTMRAWQHAGVTIPRTTYAQVRIGHAVPRSQLAPGDLVFFDNGPGGPGHVGLYLGHGQMVEAPHTGDVVKIAPIGRSDYAGARRPTA